MSRVAAALAIWLVAAVILGLLLGPHLAANDRRYVEATTSTTAWIESLPTLPAGFDPAKLVPPTTESPRPRAARTTRPRATAATPVTVDWYFVADCESGDWDRHGNIIRGTARWDDRRAGYEGGLHFSHDTWIRAGGGRFAVHAWDATREQQIEIAQSWLQRTSLAQWPVCSVKTGQR